MDKAHAKVELTLAIAITLGQRGFGYKIPNTFNKQHQHSKNGEDMNAEHSDQIGLSLGLNNSTDIPLSLHTILPTTYNGVGTGSVTTDVFNDTGQAQPDENSLNAFKFKFYMNSSSASDVVSPTSAYPAPLPLLISPLAAVHNVNTLGASGNATSNLTGHQLSVSPVDVFIVTCILIAWFIVIGIFIHKWQHLRLVEPREYRFQHKPKNLDSIKIVKKPSDSVIYRQYPIAMKKTMAARVKRLERMHTMPAIKIDLESKSPAFKVKSELANHIPILCLRSVDDLVEVIDVEDAKEHHCMLTPVEV